MTHFASGTYGKIYKIHDDIVRKELDIECLGTLNEIAFFKSYCNLGLSIFPELKEITLEENKINIFMTYSGWSLVQKMNILNYTDRLNYLPQLLIQMNNILCFLKKNKLVHMDIKPANVCWGNNEQPNLILIDYGFLIPESEDSFNHIGTYAYADPTYFKRRSRDYNYDMFSTGLLLLSWLQKIYLPADFLRNPNITEIMILDYFRFETHKENIGTNVNFLDIISKMIVLDETKRIKCDEILLKPDNFDKIEFPTIKDYENIPKVIKDNIYDSIRKCDLFNSSLKKTFDLLNNDKFEYLKGYFSIYNIKNNETYCNGITKKKCRNLSKHIYKTVDNLPTCFMHSESTV